MIAVAMVATIAIAPGVGGGAPMSDTYTRF